MRLDPAMVGRPRTTCESSAHHQRRTVRGGRAAGESPDRLTPLRHTKPANGRVVRTHYHERMGFATPRHSYGESRGAADADSVGKASASSSVTRSARRERRRLGKSLLP